MCSSPKIPDMPAPAPIEPPAPLPTPQQAPTPPVMPAPTPLNPTPAAPLPPPLASSPAAAPPPMLVSGQTTGEDATVKRLKSKRGELQQANSGTSGLRIPGSNAIGQASGENNSSNTGLNIPK